MLQVKSWGLSLEKPVRFSRHMFCSKASLVRPLKGVSGTILALEEATNFPSDIKLQTLILGSGVGAGVNLQVI